MPGYLEAIARLGLDEDVAEAGKCCNVGCVTTLYLFDKGTRHCATVETKPEGKPQDLGKNPLESELFDGLMEKGAGRNCMRLL